ncbi:MAG: S8 family serine peptidase [Candidatus Helarchaeota archaeon]
MQIKKNFFPIIIIFSLFNCNILIPTYLLIQLNPYSYLNHGLPSKIMFDSSLLNEKRNRIIINFYKGANLIEEKQNILSICNPLSSPILFDYISAIVCEFDKQSVQKIAQLNSIKGIYYDEVVSINISKQDSKISMDEIFQLNQCATIINSRAIPFTGNGVNISIIDTGIDFTHSDLAGKMLDQVSFVTEAYGFDSDRVEDEKDYDGHGTHCAGIATGTGISSPPGYNLTGIAPRAKLLNAKCLDRYGFGYLSGILAAIDWSINHSASIISMSLGFDSSDPDHPICRAVDYAVQKGIIVVAAAGNSGPFYSTIGSPASARAIITVGASDKNDQITDFSSRGPTSLGFIDPDVVAPGKNILSVAAKNSILGKITQLRNEYVYGLNRNNYMVLSGTSMSCPMTAGAVALLLEAFPNLNPYMIRIALMKGSDSLGYSPNMEGAGRINLNNSYHFLLNASPDFNITTVLPTNIPNPPFEFSMFPGDNYTDDVIILSGKQINISVRCIGNISQFVSLSPTSDNEILVNKSLIYIKANQSYFTDLNININFPFSIKYGNYTGILEIRNNDTNQILERVNLSFNIIIPRGRIYFDCFHNADYYDNVRSNYYNFTRLLFENKIDIDFGRSLISFPRLSQYDILILPDIETPFTDRELDAIKKYWESDNGGNILILGNYYPSTSIESLNKLLSILNSGINYTKNNIESSYDIGVIKFYEYFNITDLKTHPITDNITDFSWLTGVELEIDESKALSIAEYLGNPVIAVHNRSDLHRIICMGSENHFYDNMIYKPNNQKLILQTINWLLNSSQKSRSKDLSVEVVVNNPIMELGAINSTEIGFYVSDPTSGNFINNLKLNYNLSCQIFYYNLSTWQSIWTPNSSNIQNNGNGAYSFNFTTNLTGSFKVNISIKNLSSFGDGIGISFFNSTISPPKIINYSLTTTQHETHEGYDDEISNNIYRNVDSVIVNITIYDKNLITDIRNVTAYITSLGTYQNNNIKYVNIELTNITSKYSNKTTFSLVITPNFSYPAGSYKIFIEVIDSSGNIDYSSVILDFYINDKYPDISDTSSKLNGIPFKMLQATFPTTIFNGFNFLIEISGSDEESTISTMNAYVIIFSYFTIGIYAYLYEPLWGQKIPFVGTSFKSSVSLPMNGISQILDDTYSLQGSYIMLILLLDSDGQFDDESYTYTQILVQPSYLFFTTIIITIIIITGITSYLLFYFSKRKKISGKKSRQRPICPNCGSYVSETQRFCPQCGYHFSMDEFDSSKLDFE